MSAAPNLDPAMVARRLEEMVGGDHARRAIGEALRLGWLHEIPATGRGLCDFVAGPLSLALEASLGAEIASVVVRDLADLAQLNVSPKAISHPRRKAERATNPAPRPRVVQTGRRLTIGLMASDRLGRATLARRLVSAQCEVRLLDVPAALVSPECQNDLVVCDFTGEVGTALRLVTSTLGTPIIAWTNLDHWIVQQILHAAGASRFAIVPRHVAIDELLACARALVGGESGSSGLQTHKRRILDPDALLGLTRDARRE